MHATDTGLNREHWLEAMLQAHGSPVRARPEPRQRYVPDPRGACSTSHDAARPPRRMAAAPSAPVVVIAQYGIAHGTHVRHSRACRMSRFQTTRWSLIQAARDDPMLARDALEQLCRAYRPPVLAFVRHSGYSPSDAEDLTQAFFLRFLERGWYVDANPGRGRFRSLLLTALRHFLSDEHAQAVARKRGGGAHQGGDEEIAQFAAEGDGPEDAFTRAWLGTVVNHAMARLQDEWSRAGKQAQFRQLSAVLLERSDPEEVHAMAAATGLRTNTLAVQAHRMRQRLRQLVRLELLQTVGSREALEVELAELRGVLPAST
jgi:RNA polymerase sigma factor (sigma-70 family)